MKCRSLAVLLSGCVLVVSCSAASDALISSDQTASGQAQGEPAQSTPPTTPPTSAGTQVAEREPVPDWSAPGSIELQQTTPGASFVAVIALASGYEVIVGEAVAASDGTALVDYVIPTGSAPGALVLAVRDVSTGARIGASMTGVIVPAECLGGTDVDGDSLDDRCDSNLFDGPDADFDGDGRPNDGDNCPQVANADQASNFERSSGAACDGREGFNHVTMLREPCNGLSPTIVGTDGDDTLTGTDGDDIIVGLGGDDTITAGAGDDIICVTSGRNVIDAGADDDRVFGGSGADAITGGSGNDHIFAGAGDDTISDTDGDDRIDGGVGFDECAAGALAIRCEA